jgi:hypothetical protein
MVTPGSWLDVTEHVCADMTIQPGYGWECRRGCEEFWQETQNEEAGE